MAARSGCLQAGVGAFADQVAFEFGKGGEDVEDEPAAGGIGLDVLLKGLELDASLLQRIHVIHQVADGSAETANTPDHESVHGADLSRRLSSSGRDARGPEAASVKMR